MTRDSSDQLAVPLVKSGLISLVISCLDIWAWNRILISRNVSRNNLKKEHETQSKQALHILLWSNIVIQYNLLCNINCLNVLHFIHLFDFMAMSYKFFELLNKNQIPTRTSYKLPHVNNLILVYNIQNYHIITTFEKNVAFLLQYLKNCSTFAEIFF